VPGYVRGMRTTYGADASELEIAKHVAFRLGRQKRLTAKPPVLRVVLNEAVVCRPVGDMAKQLRHLVDMSRRTYLDLRVLPFAVGPHRGMTSPFSLLTLPDELTPNFVYLEHEDGALYLERPVDLVRYAGTFETHHGCGALAGRKTWAKQEGPRDGHNSDDVAQEQAERR